jgi:hypothetical protein
VQEADEEKQMAGLSSEERKKLKLKKKKVGRYGCRASVLGACLSSDQK